MKLRTPSLKLLGSAESERDGRMQPSPNFFARPNPARLVHCRSASNRLGRRKGNEHRGKPRIARLPSLASVGTECCNLKSSTLTVPCKGIFCNCIQLSSKYIRVTDEKVGNVEAQIPGMAVSPEEDSRISLSSATPIRHTSGEAVDRPLELELGSTGRQERTSLLCDNCSGSCTSLTISRSV